MARDLQNIHGPGGFTLLEVLLAVFVFSLVISLVMGAWTGTLHNVDQVQKTMFGYDAAKNCLERMREDLSSICVTTSPDYTKPENDEDTDPWQVLLETSDESGEPFPSLGFASMAHVDLSGGDSTGVARIRYYVTRDPADEKRFVLRRSDVLAWDLYEDDQKAADPVLCDRIRKVSFLAYDDEGEPLEAWDSESEHQEFATPSRIGIRLELGETGPDADGKDSTEFTTEVALPVVRGKIK